MEEYTDLTKWKLTGVGGQHVWKYLPNSTTLQTFYEKYLLGQDISKEAPAVDVPQNDKAWARKGIQFYQKLQTPDGHWANDYGGPMFLMPGLIITLYCVGHELPVEHKKEMIRYLFNQQREDGGWGLHVESQSTMFGSALNYVAARLLGVEKDHPRIVKARKWIHDHGSAKGIPSWGKFWLAALGVYEWSGLNPLTTELWMLPYWLPFHPGRFWCHCRMVYLPMSYIYGKKATCKPTDLTRSLREELYTEPYDSIDWPSLKWTCCSIDLYTKPTLFLRLVFGILSLFEKMCPHWLRRKSLEYVIDHIRLEDESTKFIDIGPVNKPINMLSVWHHEGQSENFKKHEGRIYDYLWLAEDGMKMQGYNGCQLWDTAFALQAIIATGLGEEFKDVLLNGHNYLDITQVREDVRDLKKYFRHISKGAWPFSTRDHGWPISDCTSEGLKAALLLRDFKFITPLADHRYHEAVNVIMSLQNSDGGWPTYELQRGPALLERLNPSECFHDIMVDYSYVECTSACVQALVSFHKYFPDHRVEEIKSTIARGVNFIKKIQRPDGSWIGSWAVCFTYGTWFGIEGLVAAGEGNSQQVKKACQFLLSKQRADGGWGESFLSCVKREYSENDTSQVVNTAWAVLALMSADWNKEPIERGVNFLKSKMLPNGDWKLESISGVFNANCAIAYNSYKNTFSIWALGKYATKYSTN